MPRKGRVGLGTFISMSIVLSEKECRQIIKRTRWEGMVVSRGHLVKKPEILVDKEKLSDR